MTSREQYTLCGVTFGVAPVRDKDNPPLVPWLVPCSRRLVFPESVGTAAVHSPGSRTVDPAFGRGVGLEATPLRSTDLRHGIRRLSRRLSHVQGSLPARACGASIPAERLVDPRRVRRAADGATGGAVLRAAEGNEPPFRSPGSMKRRAFSPNGSSTASGRYVASPTDGRACFSRGAAFLRRRAQGRFQSRLLDAGSRMMSPSHPQAAAEASSTYFGSGGGPIRTRPARRGDSRCLCGLETL